MVAHLRRRDAEVKERIGGKDHCHSRLRVGGGAFAYHPRGEAVSEVEDRLPTGRVPRHALGRAADLRTTQLHSGQPRADQLLTQESSGVQRSATHEVEELDVLGVLEVREERDQICEW